MLYSAPVRWDLAGKAGTLQELGENSQETSTLQSVEWWNSSTDLKNMNPSVYRISVMDVGIWDIGKVK